MTADRRPCAALLNPYLNAPGWQVCCTCGTWYDTASGLISAQQKWATHAQRDDRA